MTTPRRRAVAGAVAAVAALGLLGMLVGGRARPEEITRSHAATIAPSASSAQPAGGVSSVRPPPPPFVSDNAVWKVEVSAADPFKGKADAPVTIVTFADLESPSYKEAATTLSSLLQEQPDVLRIVWKDHPVAFHARAKPAALLARAAQQRLGNSGFWRAHDLLLEAQPQLADTDLERVAEALRLPASAVSESRRDARLQAEIERNLLAGYDVQVKGTPHFFVNGVRLAGSQPPSVFRKLIEQELAKANARLANGVAPNALYASIVQDGQQLPPLERRELPAAAATQPVSIGPRSAKVVLAYWASLPCERCTGVTELLDALELEYAPRLRVDFHLVPGSTGSELAIAAARQAFVEGGSARFKPMLEQFWPAAPSGYTRQLVLEAAQRQGFESEGFKSALAASGHANAMRSDARAAQKAGLELPCYTLGGYYFPANHDKFALRRAVQRALTNATPPH